MPTRRVSRRGFLKVAGVIKVGPEGDCRDRNKIRGWANTLAPTLVPA